MPKKNETSQTEVSTTENMNKPAEFSTADKAMYNKLVKGIASELQKVEKSYLVMAFQVHHVYVQNLYQIDGYKNIYEWSADKFKLARGTTNNYINICEKFGTILADGTCKALKPAYAEFSSSQLILMLSMDDETRDLISSDMTIKQIKEKKKAAEKSDGDGDTESTATDSTEEDDTSNATISDKLLCIMQLNDINGFNEQNLKTIHEVFEDFKEKHTDLAPTISVEIRWR